VDKFPGVAVPRVVLLLKSSSKGFHGVTKFLCVIYFMSCWNLAIFCAVAKLNFFFFDKSIEYIKSAEGRNP
jgi:hypothetical protein